MARMGTSPSNRVSKRTSRGSKRVHMDVYTAIKKLLHITMSVIQDPNYLKANHIDIQQTHVRLRGCSLKHIPAQD